MQAFSCLDNLPASALVIACPATNPWSLNPTRGDTPVKSTHACFMYFVFCLSLFMSCSCNGQTSILRITIFTSNFLTFGLHFWGVWGKIITGIRRINMICSSLSYHSLYHHPKTYMEKPLPQP
ncbi:hypothetical protein Hanom_Chr13g01233161 [Helianthus anomalus]